MWKSTSESRPCFRLKLGHDLRGIHATVLREKHLTLTARDPELKHNLNFDVHTGRRYGLGPRLPLDAPAFFTRDVGTVPRGPAPVAESPNCFFFTRAVSDVEHSVSNFKFCFNLR